MSGMRFDRRNDRKPAAAGCCRSPRLAVPGSAPPRLLFWIASP
ncbi:hypothetical protein [Lysobacter gummosus]